MELLSEILIELAATVVLLGLASLAVSWALLKGLKPHWVILTGSLVVILYAAATFLLGQTGSHPDSMAAFQKSFDQVWDLKTKSMTDSKLSPADIETVKQLCQKYLVWAWPSWVLLGSLGLGFFAYYLVSAVLSRVTPRVTRPLPFWQWRVPEPLIFGLIVGGLIKIFAKEDTFIDVIGNNLLVFFVMIYTFGGMTILSFYFQKWKLPRVARFLSYVVIFELTFNSICFLGILDVWFDFRKLKTPPPEPVQ